MMYHCCTIFTLFGCLLLPAVAGAQSQSTDGTVPLRQVDLRNADLKPVEAFTGDSTALSTSLRTVQYGLQQSADFEQLMQSGMHGDKYYRQAGGLYAMFPTSTYAPTRSGYVPTIAPGTVFHIGGLPPAEPTVVAIPDPARLSIESISPQVKADRHDARDLEGVASITPQVGVEPAPASDEPLRIRFITDEDYRRRTMLSLVWRSIDASLPDVPQAARGPLPSGSK
jgi:hypothetical protein